MTDPTNPTPETPLLPTAEESVADVEPPLAVAGPTRAPSVPPDLMFNNLLPDRVWTVLAFALPLLIFVSTTCRTLYVGDAGDFAVACWDFGIAHPPGYPLYTLLGALWSRLPIPGGETEVAWRLNLMSAFFAAGTCGFVYLLLARVGQVKILALGSALAIAVSRAFWWQSTITEVYTLNTFFMALIWWMALNYIDSGKRVQWQWMLVVMSLSLAHHQSILMFFPFIFGWIWWERGRLFPGTGAEYVEGVSSRPNYPIEIGQAAILFLLPMITLYMYLPAVDCRTPVTENRPLWTDAAGEFNYVVKEIILRNVYTNKAEFDNPTTSLQVAEHYLKYLIGDPFHSYDAFESGDQGTLALGILLALWAVALWRPREAIADLPESFGAPATITRIQHLTWLFLGCLALFVLVVCSVPSGDILNAPQTNLRVVMPPLLVPGHYYLVLAIFCGAIALWHHLANYVWGMREKDPMAPAAKLRLSRGMLAVALLGLVLVNGYNNFPVGDRSGSFISWSYVQNVVKTVDEDTFVLNTGDETFLYWYLDRVHWDLHPEQRKQNVEFTNWLHQIPSYDSLEGKTEAELQRDIIGYFMKQQLVERAARRLGATSNTSHPVHLATTFFRPEFMRVSFFRYWDVQLDGLVYKWEPNPEYEPLAIQSVIQNNTGAAPGDLLDESAVAILEEYLRVLLYERSPKFAGWLNEEQGMALDADGAAKLAPATEIGPIVQQVDGTWKGPIPSAIGMSDPNIIAIGGPDGSIYYQMPLAPPMELDLVDRDWWTFYDWRGILNVTRSDVGVQVDPPTLAFDAQEEEILARMQDLFVQHGLQYYTKATALDDQIQAMDQSGEAVSNPEAFEQLRDQHLEALLEADRWLSYAVKLPFVHNPDIAATSWGLLGDIKLNLGQFDQAELAYNYLIQKLQPDTWPIEASRARANLAIVKSARGDRAAARQLVQEALIIDPNNALATSLQEAFAGKGAPSAGSAPPAPATGGFAIRPEGAVPVEQPSAEAVSPEATGDPAPAEEGTSE